MIQKFKYYSQTLLFVGIICLFSCQQQTDRQHSETTATKAPLSTQACDDCANAKIILFVETLAGNPLAYTTLNLSVPKDAKGKYRATPSLSNEGDNGAFSHLSIVDKAVITGKDEIKIMLTYELQAHRIFWDTKQGELTSAYGEKWAKDPIKSEGGSISAIATIIFDAKTMDLISQSSVIQGDPNQAFQVVDASFEDFRLFVRKHLKLRLGTSISWHNAACKDKDCSTGLIREVK